MSLSTRFVEFADDSAEVEETESIDLVIPEDPSTLSDEGLKELHSQAVSTFDAVYGDGTNLTTEAVDALTVLTDGIERLAAESSRRAAAFAERQAEAAKLAERVNAFTSDEKKEDEDVLPEVVVEDLKEEDEEVEEEEMVASAPREIRVNLANLPRSASRRSEAPARVEQPKMGIRDVLRAVGEGTGYASGTGLDWNDVSQIVDRRLSAFNLSQYQAAGRKGQRLRQQFSVAQLNKPFAEGYTIKSSDPVHADEVIQRAISERNLPGGSLVASGGWVAPSPTVYDLVELESRDGIYSIPEIGIQRGGINYTAGPNFGTIFAGSGFNYTEAEDEAGDYDGAGGGSKPTYRVPAPVFQDVRLNLAGVAITAGLLEQRGYPELIARTVRGALVAHDHRISGLVLDAIVTASDAVAMTAGQIGAVAPLLEAVEMQVEHYRYVNRLSRATSLEAVFPFWVRGVLRADLSRRLGVDLLSVTDAQINDWFTTRGVAPQFVYNFQDLTGDADAFTAWPTEVTFLLYSAGTWVRGSSDVISLDTIYDSALLQVNDYTALFTEEGWLVMETGHDSRAVTVELCASGGTNAGYAIECDGTETPAV